MRRDVIYNENECENDTSSNTCFICYDYVIDDKHRMFFIQFQLCIAVTIFLTFDFDNVYLLFLGDAFNASCFVFNFGSVVCKLVVGGIVSAPVEHYIIIHQLKNINMPVYFVKHVIIHIVTCS